MRGAPANSQGYRRAAAPEQGALLTMAVMRMRAGARAVVVTLGAMVLALGWAVPAAAHAIGGAEPTNYRTRVLKMEPALPGVTVRPLEAGQRIQLSNTSGQEVVVLGYSGEPYLRIGPHGVLENTRSPATYLNRTAKLTSTVEVPPAANAESPPVWRQVSSGTTWAWHDHRAHWMGAEDPPQVQAAPGQEHLIQNWTIPLRQGSQEVTVSGDLRWVPGPSPWPWLAAAAALALATAALIARSGSRRWPAALAAAVAVVLLADVTHTAAVWLGVRPSLGDALGSLLSPLVGWVAGLAAIYQLTRGRTSGGTLSAVLSLGILAVTGGLGDAGALLRSQLPGALPAWALRAAVATKAGVGLGAIAAALPHFASLLRQPGRSRGTAGGRVAESGQPELRSGHGEAST